MNLPWQIWNTEVSHLELLQQWEEAGTAILLAHFTHDTGLAAGFNLFYFFFTVRQDPLLGSSEMFNSFLRKAQQVSNSVIQETYKLVEVWMYRYSSRRCHRERHTGLRKHRESCDSYTRFDAVRALLRGSLCLFLFVFPRVTAFHHPLMFTCRGWGWSWRSPQRLFIEICRFDFAALSFEMNRSRKRHSLNTVVLHLYIDLY